MKIYLESVQLNKNIKDKVDEVYIQPTSLQKNAGKSRHIHFGWERMHCNCCFRLASQTFYHFLIFDCCLVFRQVDSQSFANCFVTSMELEFHNRQNLTCSFLIQLDKVNKQNIFPAMGTPLWGLLDYIENRGVRKNIERRMSMNFRGVRDDHYYICMMVDDKGGLKCPWYYCKGTKGKGNQEEDWISDGKQKLRKMEKISFSKLLKLRRNIFENVNLI